MQQLSTEATAVLMDIEEANQIYQGVYETPANPETALRIAQLIAAERHHHRAKAPKADPSKPEPKVTRADSVVSEARKHPKSPLVPLKSMTPTPKPKKASKTRNPKSPLVPKSRSRK